MLTSRLHQFISANRQYRQTADVLATTLSVHQYNTKQKQPGGV